MDPAVRDLPILDAEKWLPVHRVRVNGPDCGPRVEQLDWLDPWACFTRRFADSIVRLAAIRSRIELLKTFARRLKAKIDGVLAHCRWPLHTSLLEGIHNNIKVIERTAYGFRDDEHFFLRIRAVLPGNA